MRTIKPDLPPGGDYHSVMGNKRDAQTVATWPQRPDIPVSTFGERVKSARHIMGLSKSELARRAGCTPGMVNQIERGVKSKKTGKRIQVDGCDAALAFRLSDALEISARWMIWGSGPVNKWEPLSPDEKEVIEAFRGLPDPMKEHAKQVILTLRQATPGPPKPSRSFPFPPAKQNTHKR